MEGNEADAWYFAIDEKPEGPFSLREIGKLFTILT